MKTFWKVFKPWLVRIVPWTTYSRVQTGRLLQVSMIRIGTQSSTSCVLVAIIKEFEWLKDRFSFLNLLLQYGSRGDWGEKANRDLKQVKGEVKVKEKGIVYSWSLFLKPPKLLLEEKGGLLSISSLWQKAI